MPHRFQRVRRALRAFDRFTLLTLNAPDHHQDPYTNQMRRTVSSPRVF
jgi:hypothetical protein